MVRVATDQAAPARLGPSLGTRLRASLSVFSVRGFPFLLGSNATNASGFQVRNMAQAWLVLELVDSEFMVGVINAVPTLALLIFSSLGGMLADRYHKRTILLCSRLSTATVSFLTAYLVAAGLIELWQLAVLGFVLGFSFALGNSASHTLVFDLVGRPRLLGAVSLNTMTSNLASVIGPALGGILVASVGVGGAFWLLAGIYGLGFLFLLGLPRSAGANQPGASQASPFRDLVDGLRYAFRTPGVNWLMVLMGGVLFWGAMQPVIPVYARDILGVGADGFGFLFGAWAAGALVTSMVIFAVGNVAGKARWMLIAISAYGAATISFAYSTSYPLSILLMFASGVAGAVWINLMSTLIQTAVAPEMRGRVVGVATALLQLLGVGYILGGAISELISPKVALVIPAAGLFAINALAYARSKEFRNFA